jgi:chromodomain-helicase-DNA-binding protein 1
MLLVDVHLCGVGNYEKIAKDPKLGLDGKFFLDEPWARSEDAPNKLIPNAESLINRGDFLLESCASMLRRKIRMKVPSLAS